MLMDPQTGRYLPTAEFLQHIDNPDVWTLTESAAAMFPDLQGHISTRPG